MNLLSSLRISVAVGAAVASLCLVSSAFADGVYITPNDGLPACSKSIASDCVVDLTVDGKEVVGLEPRVRYQAELAGTTTAIYLGTDSGDAYTTAKCAALFASRAPTAAEITACEAKPLTELAPVGSVVRIRVSIGTHAPAVATIRGAHEGNLNTPNKSWTVEKTAEGNLLTVEFKPALRVSNQAFDLTNGCAVFPTPSATSCGGETGIADWEGVSPMVHLMELDTGPWVDRRELADGMTMAINAQTNGPPIFDPVTRSVTVQTAGVHFRKDGVTPNTGFISLFVPDHLAQSDKGFDLPAGLSPEETLALVAATKSEAGKAAGPLDPTVTVRKGGILFDTPSFNFSNPKFAYARRFLSSSFSAKAEATKSAITAQLTTKAPGSVVATGLLGKTKVCSGSARGRTAGAIAVKCSISAAGKRALGRKKNQKVTLRLIFTPLGGKPKTQSSTVKF